MKKLFDKDLLISRAWELDAETIDCILSDRAKLSRLSKERKEYAQFNQLVIEMLASDDVLEQVKRSMEAEVLEFEVVEYILDKRGNYVNEVGFDQENANPIMNTWIIDLSTFEAVQEDQELEGVFHYQPLSKDAVISLSNIFEAHVTSQFGVGLED